MASLLACVVVCGCSSLGALYRRATAPHATVTAGTATVTQTGDAQKPATASTTTQTTSLPLPAGTKVTVTQPQPGQTVAPSITAELPTPSVLHIETRADHVEAPQAFAPPAPPSAIDLAKADSVKYYTWGTIGCIVLGGFLVYRAHMLAGIIAFVAAAVLHLLRTEAGLYIAGLCVVAAVVFFVAWHIEDQKKKAVAPAGAAPA